MLCVHGTTLENFKMMIAGEGKPSGAWNVSECDAATYFYPLDKIAKAECLELSDFDDEADYQAAILEAAKRHARGNATTTAAILERDAKLIIFLADVPDCLLEDDYSCDNMADIASFIHEDDFKVEMILKIWQYEFFGIFSPYCVQPDNPYTATMSYHLEQMARAIQNSNAYLYDTIEESLDESEQEKDLDFLINI
ncbi:hypothetical protein Erwinia_phage_Rouille_00120 [Erwinia phage Rouille]|nr:hypothetical protein 1Hena2_00134 [Erwinia phage Hena2]WJN64876.1 hypothetical protein Erwinia_phage_Rouille_00120 [Erwinia phage Rouille]